MKVRLSVFLPLKCGVTEVRVFSVVAEAPLQWFRNHADELARLSLETVSVPVESYTALNVEEWI